ncbi:MAG: hypothetical protein JXA57_06385 [Armatimonadetes bacterium]|nr:hypothetical protein [Armatimonadota bacterium]
MEGRRKEVVLLVLAVLALGIALYTFRGNKPAPTPAPGPATTAAALVAEAATAPGSEQATAEEAQGTEGDATGTTAAGRQRNPFSAPGLVAAGPTPGVTPGSEPTADPAPDVAPATGETSLVLTGVIDGKESVAILRQDDQRFFVRVGDLVGEGYRVQSIAHQQVVLAGQQGKVILRMGGRQ